MTQTNQIYTIQPLNESQISIIKSTIPILEQAGEKLTAKFYANMLERNPEVKVFFNINDQKTLRQPKILAFALLNYAKHIEDLSPLTSFVKQIVVKHVGLQVKAQDYPIVGLNLIATMGELLGSQIATPEFVEAWSIAYGNLAQTLINLEYEQYDHAKWDGFKSFIITHIVKEAENVKSIYFKPKDGDIDIPIRGQYVCIRWNLKPYDHLISREYSLSEFPTNGQYRISVRLIPDGLVSSYIHHDLKIGDEILVAPPAGNFTYNEEEASSSNDLVLIIGGIGITPIISFLPLALKQGKNITLLYSNKSTQQRPFTSLFQDLHNQYPTQFKIIEYFSQQSVTPSDKDIIDKYHLQRLSLSDLDFITKHQTVYLLGPRPYMKSIRQHLSTRGVIDNVKFEYFGPLDVEV
ncbi:flavohemoglobin [Scheffersomyces coipomensis]|uniref:flavohemoglobin n=1 Tax=Scheffersomyces coipomensis TaxID=1788519 RepID=UPI00315D300D